MVINEKCGMGPISIHSLQISVFEHCVLLTQNSPGGVSLQSKHPPGKTQDSMRVICPKHKALINEEEGENDV